MKNQGVDEITTRVRHVKTGGLYDIICSAVNEKTGEDVTVYRSVISDQTWVRPTSEFKDGRFVPAS